MVVGVGAKPNTDMFKGQIDLLEDKPGGIKVLSSSYHPMHTATYSILGHVISVQDTGSVHTGPMQAIFHVDDLYALCHHVSLPRVTCMHC